MRYLGILFLLLILFFAIATTCWKSLFYDNDRPKANSDTHLEKLLKGENSVKKELEGKNENQVEEHLPERATETRDFQPVDVVQDNYEKGQENNLDFNKINLGPNVIKDKTEQNENSTKKKLNEISQELSQKYGNNPDAEVSDEDFTNVMNKLLNLK